ncbi:MAG: Kelch repeat-containing protein [Candidatus Thorarchaeota archaeon]
MKKFRITLRNTLTIMVLFVLVVPAIQSTANISSTTNDANNSVPTNPTNLRGTLADQSTLPVRGDAGVAYDGESDRIIIFGGWNQSVHSKDQNETWAYNFNTDTYTKLAPSTKPPGRAEAPLVYDSNRDRIVVFGGMHDLSTLESLNDTWIFDYNTNNWTELFPASTPGARRAHGIAYDIESDKIVMFGGRDAYDNRTWVYDPATNEWQAMSPAFSPSARSEHKMVYDSESDRIILFGGHHVVGNNHSFFSDTWAYSYNSDTWENLTDSTHPSGRAAYSFAYDSESDRAILFGGATESAAYGDFWLLDYNTHTWIEVSPFGPCCSIVPSPPERGRHNAAYDTESDRVVIYGGTFGGINSNDLITYGKTWAYDLNDNSWAQMTPLPPTTSTPTSTTTPEPAESPGAPLVWIALGGSSIVIVLVAVLLVRRKP